MRKKIAGKAVNRRDFIKWTAGATMAASFIGSKQIKELLLSNPNLELFIHPYSGATKFNPATGLLAENYIGENASVWIDKKNGIVKRIFRPRSMCCGGKLPIQNTDTRMASLYLNEKATYLKLASLGSRYISPNVSFDDFEQSITMPYLGPDLLLRENYDRSWSPNERYTKQIIDMHHEYREAGIFKRSTFRTNLYWDESSDRLIASDFKEARPRIRRFFWRELQRHYLYLTALSPDLPSRLAETYSDFPKKWTNVACEYYSQIYTAGFIPDLIDEQQARRVLDNLVLRMEKEEKLNT